MRSQELTDWIAKFKTKEAVLTKLAALPKHLKQELLTEALNHCPDLKYDFEHLDEALYPIRDWENWILRSYCQKIGLFNGPMLNLAGWQNGLAPSSKILDSSNLFTVLVPSNNHERPYHHEKRLMASQGVTILHTGELLFQFDWDVFHALLCLSHGQLDQYHVLEPVKVFDLLDIAHGGGGYKMLWASLGRLAHTDIKVIRGEGNGAEEWVRLISVSQSGSNQPVYFSLPAKLKTFFSDNEYSFVDWGIRNKLGSNDLAKKLQCLFAGSKANQQFYDAAQIMFMCGLATDMASFTRTLKKALDVLLKARAITAYWVEKPKRGLAEEKIFCVWMRTRPSVEQQNPNGKRGLYFD